MVVGFQVPVTVGELVELVGNAGGVEFRHNGPIGLKVGVICETISILIVVVVTHCPAAGVNVYVVVPVRVVLIVAGIQVPVMTGILVETEGNDGGGEFSINGPIGVKVGVIWLTTLTVNEADTAH